MPRTIRIKLYHFSELRDNIRPDVIRQFMRKAFSMSEIQAMPPDEYDTVYNNIAIMLHKNEDYEFTKECKLA